MRLINIKLFSMASLLALSLLSMPVMANNNPGKPVTCPPASGIATATLINGEFNTELDAWLVVGMGKYGTQKTWIAAVVVPPTEATSVQDAINKASATLPSVVSISNKMMNVPNTRIMACIYNTNANYLTFAMSTLH